MSQLLPDARLTLNSFMRNTQQCSITRSNFKLLSVYFTFIITDFNNFQVAFMDYFATEHD